jgi:DNA-directed RNA polymerase specialized sigma24 family protein
MNDWDRIVREHGPGVFATAWRILGHATAAENVVQEVFRRARQDWLALDPDGEALRGVAACEALDQLARLEDVSTAAGRLRQALAHLPRREAAAFCLRYFDGLTCGQVARALRLSPAAMANALQEARRRLESLMAVPASGS